MRMKVSNKQTEVGIIPSDWNVVTLKEGIQLLSGHHILAENCNNEGKGFRYITGPADFPNGKIQISKYTETPSTICKKNDILITVKGSGAGSLVLADSEYCISRQLMAIRSSIWSTEFLYFLLKKDESIFKLASTGLIPGLSRSDILSKKIPIPSNMEEQKIIASTLNDFDELIDDLEKLITKKRNIKQGAMQLLLTPKGNWNSMKLGKLCEIITKGTTPTSIGHDFHSEGINFVKIESIKSNGQIIKEKMTYIDNITHNLLKRSQLKPNDILFSIAGALGRVAILKEEICPANTNQALSIIRLSKSGTVDHQFLFYLLCSERIQKHVQKISVQGAQANLSLRDIYNLHITFPEYHIQTQIATILNDIDAEILALEVKLGKFINIKQGIMQNLLTGKIRLL